MAKSTKRIGDDQLVGGLPKHMAGVSTHQSLAEFKKAEADSGKAEGNKPTDPKGNYYWTVHPKPGACDKCKAMEGKEFMEKPERPHPNCKCEIRKHPLRRPKRYIIGSLSDHEWHRFIGGKHVHIRLKGIWGGATTGVWIEVNGQSRENVACPPQTKHTINLTALEDAPVTWVVRLVAHGSANIQVDYTIIYEDWDD